MQGASKTGVRVMYIIIISESQKEKNNKYTSTVVF